MTTGDNRTLWIVLGLVAAVALVAIIAVSMSGGDDGGTGGGPADDPGSGVTAGGYTAEVEQAFMDACVAGGDQAVCECSYDRITETIPFDRFAEMEAALADDPTQVPEELTAIRDECEGAT